MITPRFLTLVLGPISIPSTFKESIMTFQCCLAQPAIKNSVFSSLSLSQLIDIQLLISDVHKWSCSAVCFWLSQLLGSIKFVELFVTGIHMKEYMKHSDDA